MPWVQPSSLEERFKRSIIPPRWELARITRRELKRGEPELRLVSFLARRDRISLDIGANRGIWTHVLARYSSEVIAFEPSPKLFPILEAARPANARALRLALSDRDGTGDLEVPRLRAGWSNQHASLNPRRNSGREVRTVEVEMRRLDSLDVGPVGFIKIDVEGHEKEVLAGAGKLIARDRPRMVIELEERHTGRPLADAVAEIEALGYDAFFLRNGTLTRFAELDVQAEHTSAADMPYYVNNFIFLPR